MGGGGGGACGGHVWEGIVGEEIAGAESGKDREEIVGGGGIMPWGIVWEKIVLKGIVTGGGDCLGGKGLWREELSGYPDFNPIFYCSIWHLQSKCLHLASFFSLWFNVCVCVGGGGGGGGV